MHAPIQPTKLPHAKVSTESASQTTIRDYLFDSHDRVICRNSYTQVGYRNQILFVAGKEDDGV